MDTYGNFMDEKLPLLDEDGSIITMDQSADEEEVGDLTGEEMDELGSNDDYDDSVKG